VEELEVCLFIPPVVVWRWMHTIGGFVPSEVVFSLEAEGIGFRRRNGPGGVF
jgi:hypothetical protein